MRDATDPLFKVGNLAKFRTRGGKEEVVVILSWEASEEWTEVYFGSGTLGGNRQWVATRALELINERR